MIGSRPPENSWPEHLLNTIRRREGKKDIPCFVCGDLSAAAVPWSHPGDAVGVEPLCSGHFGDWCCENMPRRTEAVPPMKMRAPPLLA